MSETNSKTLQSGLEMIYLASCALWGKIPQREVVEAMDFADVYRFAKRHSLAAVTYYGLEPCLEWCSEPRDDLEHWRQDRDMAIRKNLMLDLAREDLISFLEQNGARYLPLKGTVLKELYPKPGMRQMADNDLLIDPAFRRQVFDFMVSRGYEGRFEAHSVHDVYLKKPCYNFEIHNTLFSSSINPLWAEYYGNVWDRLIGEDSRGYRFRDEDLYVYVTAHAYKHHSHCGNGVRHLLDTVVCFAAMPEMDLEYLRCELERLGLAEYEETIRGLSEKLFGSACYSPSEIKALLTAEEMVLLERSLELGTYGTFENLVMNSVNEIAKGKQITPWVRVKYFFARFFSSADMKGHFPNASRYKILHPVLYLARAVRALICRRKDILYEIKTAMRVKKK